jgi:hypothetical protein
MRRSSCLTMVSDRAFHLYMEEAPELTSRMSLHHHEHPFSMNVNGEEFGVGYWPGDSRSGMFGGNSNWRGPIWFAVNLLLIER